MPPDLHQFKDIVPLLQASISPITVISGVGLLLLSMTNRYGRVIDRTRALLKDIAAEHAFEDTAAWHVILDQKPRVKFLLSELTITYKRARMLRWSITFSLITLFLIALTISFLFSGLLMGINLLDYTANCFMGALLMLLLSLGFFIRDVLLSLHALKIEIDYTLPWNVMEP